MGTLDKVNAELKDYLNAYMDVYEGYHMERNDDSYD